MIAAMVPLLLTAPTGALTGLPASQPQDQVVQVSLDEKGEYLPGHDAQVKVRPEFDGFLLVLQVDPAGQVRVLFPLEPFDDAFVEGGKQYEIVNRGGRGAFYVDETGGIGTVFAAHSEFPFYVNPFAQDHRWDYTTLVVSPDTDIETGLVDLVVKMSHDGWFQYDIVEYEVYGDGSYASGATYSIDPEPAYICCTSSVSTTVYIGPGYYYPYGYPWYFSSSWYYSPYPYYYGSYYAYWPRYRYPYYGGRYYGRDYRFKTPYRYDRGGSPNPYRPRVGVDGSRHAFGGGGRTGYRDRAGAGVTATFSPNRRTTPVSTASYPVGRRSSPTGQGAAGGTSPGVGTRPGGRVGTPRTTGTATPRGAERFPITTTRRAPQPAGDSPGRRTGPRAPTGDRAGLPTRRTTPSPARPTTRPQPGRSSPGKPTLNRRTAGGSPPGARPSGPPRASGGNRSPKPRASRPSSSGSRRASPPPRPSRPQARPSGGASRKAPARSASRSSSKSSGRRPR